MTAPKDDPTPMISIGLPVYNGEDYIVGAITSLLDQSYRDFELIISDNCSTDRTSDICQRFARLDPRIRYERQKENIGASGNHNRVFELARGKYFKWAAHDDLCHPDFLRACLEVMESRQDAVLCHSECLKIDAKGNIAGLYRSEEAVIAQAPHQRLWQIISRPHGCIIVFGLIRRDAMAKTKLLAPHVGSDRNMLAELALQGKLLMVAKPLFKRRAHAQSSVHKFEDEEERLRWFDPTLQTTRSMPSWVRWKGYLRGALKAKLNIRDKLRSFIAALLWPFAFHHTGPRVARLLWQELAKSAQHGFTGFAARALGNRIAKPIPKA